MSKKLGWESFKERFHPSWHSYIKPIIESEEVWEIYQKLKAVSGRGKRIVPESKNTFRTFKEMNLNNLKIVWVLQDPYPGIYSDGTPQATGIAMDCSNSPDGRIQPSLSKFYEGIQASLQQEIEYSKDLLYLQQQGVMLLNSDLTCEAHSSASHETWWEPFMKKLFKDCLSYRNGLIYIFSGDSSKRLEKYVFKLGNYTFNTEHPARASYGQRPWKYEDVFNKSNQIIKGNLGAVEQIYWSKKELDQLVLELPF